MSNETKAEKEIRSVLRGYPSLTIDSVREELANIYRNEPVFPGDTVSHSGAYLLSCLGWIRRWCGRDWILTARGHQARIELGDQWWQIMNYIGADGKERWM